MSELGGGETGLDLFCLARNPIDRKPMGRGTDNPRPVLHTRGHFFEITRPDYEIPAHFRSHLGALGHSAPCSPKANKFKRN